MAPSDPRRRNPPSRRAAALSRPERTAPPAPPPGYPPLKVIEGWRRVLLADDAFLRLERPGDPAAAWRRLHAWWGGLDLATCAPDEVADVWAWRRDEARDPPPARGWDELMRMYDGDRDALRADLAAEAAERAAAEEGAP